LESKSKLIALPNTGVTDGHGKTPKQVYNLVLEETRKKGREKYPNFRVDTCAVEFYHIQENKLLS